MKDQKNTKTYTDENGKRFKFNHKAFNERISVLADDNHTKIHIVLEKLVGQLNITYEALKKWKQGGNAPSDLEYVEKLAECIGMDPSELLIPLEEGIIMKKYAPTKDSEIIQTVFEKCVDIIYDYAEGDDEESVDRCRESIEGLHKIVDEAALYATFTTRYQLHKLLIEFYHAVDYPFVPARWLEITNRVSDEKWNPFHQTIHIGLMDHEFDSLKDELDYIDRGIGLAERLNYYDNNTEVPENIRNRIAQIDAEENMNPFEYQDISAQLTRSGYRPDKDTEFEITPEILWIDTMVLTLRKIFKNDFEDVGEV